MLMCAQKTRYCCFTHFIHNIRMKKQIAPGFALLEVLLSLALISSALFSLVYMQLHNVRLAHALLYKTIAREQIDNGVTLVQSNKHDLLLDWQNDNKTLLPRGKSGWQVMAKNYCQLWIRWFYARWYKQTLRFRC